MRACLAVIAALGLLACRPAPAPPAPGWPLYQPPPGQILVSLIASLDRPMPEGMWEGKGAPAIVSSYTDLRNLMGLESAADIGAGTWHASELMRRFPHSALALAVYVRDQTEDAAAGQLDAQMDRLIDVTAAYRRPVYLRFGYEFDGTANRYEPRSYRAAWLRLRSRIVQRRARHITMVWHASATCGPTFRHRPLSDWYPGDEAVDWVGLSYFRPNACGGVLADGVVAFARQRGKPVMVAEAAPRGFDLAGGRYSNDGVRFNERPAADIWKSWFLPYFDFVRRNRADIRIVNYINHQWDAYPRWRSAKPDTPYPYWGDSRLDADSELMERWRGVAHQPGWRWGDPRLFRDLGYVAPPE